MRITIAGLLHETNTFIEGALLQEVRDLVGPSVPVIANLEAVHQAYQAGAGHQATLAVGIPRSLPAPALKPRHRGHVSEEQDFAGAGVVRSKCNAKT